MIFVDTSFWVAFRNRRDQHHEEATGLLAGVGEPLICTNHVRGETWTYLRRKAGHASAVGFLEGLGKSRRISVIHVLPELETTAITWLRRHDERSYSFVDATSFALMRSMKIHNAFAFDGDFTAAGFRELRI